MKQGNEAAAQVNDFSLTRRSLTCLPLKFAFICYFWGALLASGNSRTVDKIITIFNQSEAV